MYSLWIFIFTFIDLPLISFCPKQKLCRSPNVQSLLSKFNIYITKIYLVCLLSQSMSPQRLTYSPDVPLADAAKLYWHFYRADQSGAAGVIITVFLYAVHFLLSITILSIYLFRWATLTSLFNSHKMLNWLKIFHASFHIGDQLKLAQVFSLTYMKKTLN